MDTKPTNIPGEVKRIGDTLHVDLWYPGLPENPQQIQVALMCTRAADDIRISYDYTRDGWVISQSTDAMDCSEDWQEVAFVKAWALCKDIQ